MAIKEALDELVPILSMMSLAYPRAEGAIVIDLYFRDVGKYKAKIPYNVVLVMEEGSPGESRVITTCSEHVLGRAIWRSTGYFANKFHLSCSNHVSCSRNVIEHASNVLVPYSFVLNSRH